ncbi:hypothetical protein M8J76_010067 [Diaphorina citri]|nr:hypothetical protein M8J75_013711 [Diaphorina citri]KAI5737106.1 hypothetical protein M8J76_010067 [Diaphorina citri]KAI5743854.1 hypothetical protein M8J77_022915 [Diaphorina citri]
MRYFILTFTLLVAIQPHESSATSKLDEIFSLIKDRLNLASDVAAAKLKTCKVIEDLPREADILANVTSQGTTYGLTKEAVQTFYKAQMEANKVIQYNAVVQNAVTFNRNPTPDLAEIRTKITALDNKILPLVKPAVTELGDLYKTREGCLEAISKQVDPAQSDYFKTALLRATTLFIETCLSPPICTTNPNLGLH